MVLLVVCCEDKKQKKIKTLYLIRHAKSSNAPVYDNQDFERPLKKIGKQDAKELGDYLNEKEVIIDRIYTSAAKRTRGTAKRVAKGLGMNWKDIEEDSALYKISTPAYLDYLRNLPDSLHQIALVGHNPATLEAINYLQLDTILNHMPKGGIAAIQFYTTSWKNLSHKSGLLVLFASPTIYTSPNSILPSTLDSIESTITEEELNEEVIDLMKK